MVYQYVLTFENYMDAQRLYLKHRRAAAIRYYLLVWALPIIGVFATVPFLLGEINHDTSKPMAMYAGLAAGGAWFAIFIPINRWFTMRRCWKAVVPPERVGKPTTLEFTDESVISTIPGQSEGRFFWTAIPDFVQNDRITLIFVRKKKFLFIPTKDIPPEQWAYVRTKLTPLLNRNL